MFQWGVRVSMLVFLLVLVLGVFLNVHVVGLGTNIVDPVDDPVDPFAEVVIDEVEVIPVHDVSEHEAYEAHTVVPDVHDTLELEVTQGGNIITLDDDAEAVGDVFDHADQVDHHPHEHNVYEAHTVDDVPDILALEVGQGGNIISTAADVPEADVGQGGHILRTDVDVAVLSQIGQADRHYVEGVASAMPPSTKEDLGIDENTLFHYAAARTSLASSSWPADHADNARSKFTLFGGLPQHYHPEDIKIDRQRELDTSFTWLYTAGNHSEWLYLMGSTVKNGTVVAKLDSITLEIIQKIYLPRAIYLGGLVIHANGHIYGIQSNVFYRFWNGDLYNMTSVELPTYLPPRMTMTNGLLVTSDGYIVAKQWAMNAADIIGYTYFKPSVYGPFLFFFIVYSILIRCVNKKSNLFGNNPAFVVAFLLALMTFFVVLSVVMAGRAGGPINKLDFILNGYFDLGNGGSEIKLIDPTTLHVERNIWSYERGSYARMTLCPVKNYEGETEDAIIFLGDEHVFQYRWRPNTKELFSVSISAFY
jgi:hypothetical protein